MEVVILNENGDSVGNLEIVDEIFNRELTLLKQEQKFQEAVKSLGDKKVLVEQEQVLHVPQFG